MDADFNTAQALGAIFTLVGEVNRSLNAVDETPPSVFAHAYLALTEVCQVLGVYSHGSPACRRRQRSSNATSLLTSFWRYDRMLEVAKIGIRRIKFGTALNNSMLIYKTLATARLGKLYLNWLSVIRLSVVSKEGSVTQATPAWLTSYCGRLLQGSLLLTDRRLLTAILQRSKKQCIDL